jgi:DNA (cytosine-5)-methyltransferase 1
VTAVHAGNDDPPAKSITGTPHAPPAPPLALKVDRSRAVRPATTEPWWTITGGGNHLFLAVPPSWLVPYYGSARRIRDVMQEPSGTLTADDRYGVLHGTGDDMPVEDYAFRMLASSEIQRAMQFPDTYQVLGTQRERIKQLGNAVTPGVMRWLVDRVLEAMLGRPRTYDPSQEIQRTWRERLGVPVAVDADRFHA